MRAASVAAPPIIARPALATNEALARTAERTVASNDLFAWPRTLKQWRWLMHVGRKLRFVRNAPRRTIRRRSRWARPWSTVGRKQMKYTVVMIPSATRTRVLLTQGPDELLRALLPSPSQMRHERAAITFLEGLALWLDAKLHVVLSVDAREAGFCLGLTDEMGIGMRSVFFDVEVHDRARRRRGQRMRGVGDFAELRQLRLVPDGN
jgi:hypothetical protein